ncbi:50S ribosomal protein L9 [Dyadobacter frigoris]|uniref:Large ribosomal subunit protein bL9 n=1 Tax=Dyadobacter frigoris TaxID=2576211 RepID=A0A4U6D2P9_9BACT|nr:50S ribosomal protein L9 [Dyadobacter frigoris]TKT90916.1 50S ribosomal protein L9 [Dyadobacter frigoris]GLU56720.1 50S ribosomal protein L9 [Dyadobacter frigoris]
MEIILITDIAGVGYKNDIVNVKAGFGRNYLIPQGFALLANDSNRKIVAENVRQASHKAEKLKKDAEDVAAAIGDLIIDIRTVVGESGRIFGRVTNTQVADVLKSKGFDIDRKKITVDDVKSVGTYSALIDLHKEVKHKVTLNVIAAED